MFRRTLLRLGLAAAALGAGLPAVRAEMAAEVTEPVTISFYSYNLASAGVGKDTTLDLVNDFMAANPLITVEPIAAPSNEILSRVQADIVAGLEPDVAQLVFRDLIYAATDLGAQPLED